MDLQRFQEQFFSCLSKTSGKNAIAERLGLIEEAEISYFMDLCPVQDAFRYRAKYLGLRIAANLIDEKGEFDLGYLEEMIQFLGTGFYLLGPRREGDPLIFDHFRRCLTQLHESKEIVSWIRKFSIPVCHKKGEELIRETLWPDVPRVLQTAHVRRAALAAWLTFLRQTTGSCFATAPAILIQQNHPIRFFKDLYDLVSTGRMKKVIDGKEYSVPLSFNAGKSDLQKPLNSLESLCFSPGLWTALEVPGTNARQKIGFMRALLEGLEGIQTTERVIRSLLLKAVGLSEEDLSDEEHLASIQMAPLLARNSAVYYQKPSERAQRVAEWKKRFAKACSVFQSFAECALLRSWEYTIASFCDVKVDFARWNLYVGLGLHPEQKGGIGAFLYGEIDLALQRCNREVQRLHKEYEQALSAAHAIESMMQGTFSAPQEHKLKSEYAGYAHSANTALEMRDQMIAKAEALTGFFNSLLQQYDQKLQEYFQELFDPSLFHEEAHLYDDSLAGFRLVYKHGRSDASQWSIIENEEDYTRCLRDFFSNIEHDLIMPPQLEREIITQVTTDLIRFIQEPEFLQSALQRSKEKGRRSPWEYISGGTMETLLQAYCGRERPFTEEKLALHSEEGLLQLLCKVETKEPVLMHSPTHAFIYYPSWLPSNAEILLEQSRQAVRKWKFTEVIQEHIAHQVGDRLPSQERALFLHLFRQKPTATTPLLFRQHLIEALQGKNNPIATVDSVIYEQMPLYSLSEAKTALSDIFKQLGLSHSIAIQIDGSLFGPSDLHRLTKAILLESFKSPFAREDWDRKIAQAMRDLHLCYPHPLFFADTNWSGWLFGFVVNPVTHHLELWRLNRIGLQGFPMADWKQWLSEKNTAPWILLSHPQEYADAF